MTRWIERWNAYWFPRTSTLPLALCRIVAVSAQLFWLRNSLGEQIHLAEKNSAFIYPQLLIRGVTAIVPRDVLFTPSGLTGLHWIVIGAGVLALVGFFTPVALLIFALGNWIFVAHLYSYADVHHPEAVFSILLLLLAFAPVGDRLSVDALLRRQVARRSGRPLDESGESDVAIWPLKVAHVLIALTYLSTGLTKLVFGGLAWMNGYTLQAYLLADGLRRNLPLGLWVAQHRTLCVLLSIGTVIFELLFFVSLFLPRKAPYFFLGGLVFQLGLLLTAGHKFYPHMVVLVMLLFFLQTEWWLVPLKRHFRLPWVSPGSRGQAQEAL